MRFWLLDFKGSIRIANLDETEMDRMTIINYTWMQF